MAAYISVNGEYKPLVGNKIVSGGRLLEMKATDKVVINGKGYFLGDYVDPVTDFPYLGSTDCANSSATVQGLYYALGEFVYDDNTYDALPSRYRNFDYSKLYSSGAITKDGVFHVGYTPVTETEPSTVISALNAGDSIVDLMFDFNPSTNEFSETKMLLTRNGYIEDYISGDVVSRFYKNVKEAAFREGRIYYVTNDGKLYQGGTLIADGFSKIAKTGLFAISSGQDIFMTNNFYSIEIYDDTGFWEWSNGVKVYINSFGIGVPGYIKFHGYGIRMGQLMYMDSYPVVIDSNHGWTCVSDNIIPYTEYSDATTISRKMVIYGICNGNLYKIDGQTVSAVSTTGDWVKCWGAWYSNNHITTDSVYCVGFAGRSDGHLFKIEDTTLTDLGIVNTEE